MIINFIKMSFILKIEFCPKTKAHLAKTAVYCTDDQVTF